uniref:Late nodulin n=1 Tax=Bursaphelenchus xylophilus TaxID=6326 RepID=A0A1I7S849_BURXY
MQNAWYIKGGRGADVNLQFIMRILVIFLLVLVAATSAIEILGAQCRHNADCASMGCPRDRVPKCIALNGMICYCAKPHRLS